MCMLVWLACVWLSLVPSRLATASFSGSGDNLLSPSSNEIGEGQKQNKTRILCILPLFYAVICGNMQYLNATNDCNDCK